MYVIVVCYSCGRFLLARTIQKTRKCPYCETQLKLTETKKVAHSKTAKAASDYLRELKRKRNE